MPTKKHQKRFTNCIFLRIASYPSFFWEGFFWGSVKSLFAKGAFRCPSGVAVRPPSAVPPPQARPVVGARAISKSNLAHG